MPAQQLDTLLRFLVRQAGVRGDEPPDGVLLERFLSTRDGAAFAVLVERHGAMVYGVCRRVLLHVQDAEDAFQAVFLILLRRAADLRRADSVAAWLHTVATRLALRVRADAARRPVAEGGNLEMVPAEPDPSALWEDVRPVLDEELHSLPEKYRVPVVLCHLEGCTHAEAARRLGWPLGTVAGRLARARALLRDRLTRRGITLSSALLVTLLAEKASAALPAGLAKAAVRGALAVAAASTAGLSTHVLVLAEEGMQAMFAAKVKVGAMLTVTLALTLAGAGVWARQAWHNEPEEPGARAEARFFPPEGPAARTDLYGDAMPEGAVVRLGTTRMRQAGPSDHVFLPDNKTVLTAGRNRALRFWDVMSGRLVREVKLQGTRNPSWLVTLSPDGKLLAAHDRNTLVLWEVESGRELKTLPVPDKAMVNNLRISPDGKTLAVQRNDWLVSLWDWEKGVERLLQLPTAQRFPQGPDSTTHGYFSPDGKWFVAGIQFQQPLGVFEVDSGREVHRLPCFAFTSRVSPDGKQLVVLSGKEEPGWREKILRTFDLESGKEEKAIPLGETSCYRIAFSPDGQVLALALSDHIGLLDRATGRELKRLPGRHWGLMFSPDGKTLVAGGSGRLHTWDVATGKEHQGPITDFPTNPAAAVSPDGLLLAAAAWSDSSVSLWDARSGRLVKQFSLKGKGEEVNVRNLAFSPDGRTLFAAQYTGFLQAWDVATGRERHGVQLRDPARPEGQTAFFYHLHFSSDGKHVSTLERSREDSTWLALWDMGTGKLVSKQAVVRREMRNAAWFADGLSVALPLDDGLTMLDLLSGAVALCISEASGGPQLHAPEYGYIMGMAPGGWPVVSLDERLLAGWRKTDGQGNTLGVWEIATGKEVTTLKMNRADRIALTPDNRFLVTVDDQALRVWDLATGQERRRWSLPSSAHNVLDNISVYRLFLFPDGRRAFTTLADGTALIWDLAPALRPAAPLAKGAGARELAAWWTELADEDAKRAYAAVWRLAEVPENVMLPFLRQRVRPATAEDAEKVRALIKGLDSDAFEARERAFQQLQTLGDAAKPLLREALEKSPSVEARRQIDTLLGQAPGIIHAPETLRRLRTLQVVERIGSDAARNFLHELAAGVPHAPETRAASAAVKRMERHRTNP